MSEDIAERLGNVSAKLSRFETALHSPLEGPRAFFREVVQGIPSMPVLVCKRCRAFVCVCPECGTYSSRSGRPRGGELVNCPNCELAFCTSERSAEFDRLLGKNAVWSWWSKAIYGAIVGVGLVVVLRFLSTLVL